MNCVISLARAAVAAALLSAAPTGPTTGDWPAWRGPQRDGLCRETGLARRWPEGGPPLVWKATGLGEGYSTPSIVGRLILVMGNRRGAEYVMALDRQRQGAPVWEAALGRVRHDGSGYPGPRSTPTVDGRRVYALGLNGDLVALDLATGERIWKRDLVADLGGTIPNWGYSESVLVDGPWVICTPGGAQATLAALDKRDGRIIWTAPIGDPAGYASPIRIEAQGTPQYVQFTARGVVGVDAAQGRFLWRYDAPANGTANAATPIAAGTRVMAASGYGTGGGAVELAQQGRSWRAVEAYFTRDLKNHHGGLLLIDGHVYGANDPGRLTCLDFQTGEVKWSERAAGKCSLVYADGMLVTRSEDGKVSLVAADPRACQLLGSFAQEPRSGQPTWPHPVIAGRKLYLRDQDLLLCYELADAQHAARSSAARGE